jgi:hypothetical protein
MLDALRKRVACEDDVIESSDLPIRGGTMSASPTPSGSPTGTVQEILHHITGHLPSWFGPALPFIAATIAWLLLPQQVIGGLRWSIAWLRRHKSKGDRRRAARRARFASAMAEQVGRISELEEWRDERFAEMDAEVEIYGRRRQGRLRRRQRETIQRVPSLSAALERSTDRIILLEGEPGCGKSVALRHVALRLALRVKKDPSENGVIPIYLNLKNFRPKANVDATTVLDFVKTSINRANDRYVEMFLEQEFDRGIDEGTWLFLFDSFDEIPAVLGAVEADEVIAVYANALYDFLSGMNACRGIIASREFRGPKRISWPKFHVLRLTDEQRKDLIEKLDMPSDSEQRILSGIATADPAVRQLADNPLFLALLCEHQRDIEIFPQNSHIVFENYVAKRFRDDEERVQRRFTLTAQYVREVAEQAAYCMASQPGLGLSPGRAFLLERMNLAGFLVDDQTTKALNALEYLRLARAAEAADGEPDGFTFAHRRFQEYFATCLVMRESFRADTMSLLTNGRWRETAVTLLQTQSESAIQPLLRRAEELLMQMASAVGRSDENMVESTIDSGLACSNEYTAKPFNWPPGSLHLLGLLQDGIPSGDHRRSPRAEALAGQLLKTGYSSGQLHDRRWVIEVCLAGNPDTAHDIVREAFASDSAWLREAAYTQAGRLNRVPADVRQQMRSTLAELAAAGRLRQQRLAVNAQLRRLPDPRPELLLERVFRYTPFVDAILLGILACVASALLGRSYALGAVLFAVAAHLGLYFDRDARWFGQEARYSGRLSRLYNALETIMGAGFRKGTVTFAAICIRVLALAQLGLELANAHKAILLISLCVIIFGFVGSWGLAANRADILLHRPTVLKIAALPLAWACRPFRTGDRIKELLEEIPDHLIGAVIALVIFGILAFLVVLVAHFLGKRAAYAGYALISLNIVWIVGIYRNLKGGWHDRGLLRKMERDQLSCTSFADMLKAVGSFRTQRALLLFLQEVKRRRITAEFPMALRALRAVANIAQANPWFLRSGAVSESAGPIAAVAAGLEPSEIDELNQWVTENIITRGRVALNQASIDEIGKMVADFELARLMSFPVSTDDFQQ